MVKFVAVVLLFIINQKLIIMTNIRKPLQKEDDCGCGKSVKITERKKINYRRIIKKKV
jgi:hypothetical protein